jgi:regulator of RNase E activity RraA
MRDLYIIQKETTPADSYDALSSIVGKTGQRVINGLKFVGDGQFFGRAVTLRSLPARPDHVKEVQEEAMKEFGISDPLSEAISLCDEKSVLVVDASGYNHSAIGGGTKFSALAARNAAGLVTDGALRDQSEFKRYAKDYGMKTNCCDWTIQSGTGSALFPSDINVPVTVHGVLVRPGDYMFGDENAVLVIPEMIVEEVLELGVVNSKMNDFVTAMLEETKGTMGREVKPKTPEAMEMFLMKAQLSERQMELFKKYMGGGEVA